MEITINGKARTVPDACTLNAVLALQGADPAHVVVEINRMIVPKDDYGTLRVNPCDRVEILCFVGGG